MAEILGLTASVIGVLQLTGSLIQICYDYQSRVRNAPKDLEKISNQLVGLRNVLERLLEVARSEHATGSSRLSTLELLNEPEGLLVKCNIELATLQRKLKPAQGWRLIRKALAWPLKEGDVKKTLEYLERTAALLSFALTADQTSLTLALQDNVTALLDNLKVLQGHVSTNSSALAQQGGHLLALHERADNERRYDEKNRYRIYRKGEVYLLRRQYPNDPQQGRVTYANAPIVEYYDAEVEGRLRIVKRYRDFEAFQRALGILDILSQCSSVNIAQLEGHSFKNSIPHFLVLKGDLRPFLEHITSLSDAPRYLESIRAMGSIVDSIIFLRNHNLVWTNETNKLMLNSRGEVVLGVTDDIKPLSERPSTSGRIPILTDWETRNDGTLTFRRSKSLSIDKMRSEQPLINALHQALTHPEPSLWAVSDVADLWRRYVAEWGSLLSSCTKTVRIAKLEPLIGFGYLQKDIHGHRQLVNICPVTTTGDHSLRHRSYHVPSDGRAVPDNYSFFHGASVLTDVREVRATARHDTSHFTAWDCMLRFGPIRAAQHGIPFKDLIFVYQVTQRLSAFLISNDSCASGSRYHFRPPNPDGFLPEPWGYFSTDDEPRQDNEILPTKCQGVVNGKLLFENNSEGVSAVIKHYYKISFIQLQSRDATLVEWMHNRFSSSASSHISVRSQRV